MPDLETIYTYFFAIARWFIAALSLMLAVAWVRHYKGTKPAPSLFAELTTVDGVSA